MIPIHSSHAAGKAGWAFLCDDNGVCVDTNVSDEFGELPKVFNLAEYKSYYGKVDDSIDILDVGYILTSGEYVPPESDYRDDCAKNAVHDHPVFATTHTAMLGRTPMYTDMQEYFDATAIFTEDTKAPKTHDDRVMMYVRRCIFAMVLRETFNFRESLQDVVSFAKSLIHLSGPDAAIAFLEHLCKK